MKKLLLIALVLLSHYILFAQTMDDQKDLLTSKTNTYGFTILSLTDPYLSPLTYTGNGVQFEHESRRFFTVTGTNISMQSKFQLEGGLLLSPPQTSSMTYLAMDYSWGMHYHFRPMKGLVLMAGGTCDIDLGYKDVARNINNPGNVDLAADLNLSGIAMYDIPLRRRTLKLKLAVETPLVGWMFVPLAGASYYEMFELGNLSNVSHYSTIINRRGINPKLTIDIPFERTVWQVGVSYQTLKYKANNMVFGKNETCFILGTTFDDISFGGRKRKAPDNFISPNQ